MQMVILEPAAAAADDEDVAMCQLSTNNSNNNNNNNNNNKNDTTNRLFPVTSTSDPSCTPRSSIANRAVTDNQCICPSQASLARLVTQDGRSNIYWRGVDGRLRKYVIDAMTSIAQLPFYYHALAFMAALFISWTLFGLLWWLMAAVNGDLIGEDDYDMIDSRSDSMCTQYVHDFASALLYSVETQTTLGYGTRVTNPACVQSLVLLIVQLVVGLAIDGVIAGLVFDKLTRSRRRTEMTRFARRAVIYRRQEDSSYWLAIRVWYNGRSPLLSATVRAYYIDRRDDAKETSDAGVAACIDIKLDSGFALFPWPETITHRIDSGSPFWNMSADDLSRLNFELIIVLDGTVESTGIGCQYMTSYKASEITWGHVFAPLTMKQQKTNSTCCERSSISRHFLCHRIFATSLERRWSLNCSRFDDIEKCEKMSRRSAREATVMDD